MKKNKSKRKENSKKKIFIIVAIFFLFSAIYFAQTAITGKSTTIIQDVETQPLSQSEKSKIINLITTTEFIKDIPKNNPIVLRFYKFENSETVWQDGFLLHPNFPYNPLSDKEPSLFLSMPSRYINEVDNDNLCEVIQKAKNNEEISVFSEQNKAILLVKYAKLIKHKECFGL
jgi:hypothetical protein